MKRISKDEYYLGIALSVSKRSTCLKRHYGAVIVNNDIIVATGYNGSPRGSSNCCDVGFCKRANAERYSDYTLCESVHAEQNALIASERAKTIGGILYLACEDVSSEVTVEDVNPIPCPLCHRMLKNAGIKRIVNRSGEVEI